MKKYSLLVSVVVLAAMLLAACAGATNTGNNVNNTGIPQNNTGELPGGNTSGDTSENDAITTPEVTETSVDTSGTDGSDPSLTTATPEGDAGSTGGDTGTQATPEATAETGSASDTDSDMAQGNFILLSDLMAMRVNGMDGQEIGMVNGVVVDRSAVMSATDAAGSTTGSDAGSTTDATPEATSDAGSGTTGGDTAGSTGDLDMATAGNNPRVTYLLVNVTGQGTDSTGQDNAGQGNGVLVPFQAFVNSDATQPAANTDTNSTDALTLNIDATSLANVPDFGGDVAAADWDTDVAQYWSDQGMSIPMTGAETATENGSVLFQGQIGSLSINGADNSALGNVQDLVVDLQTGDILYAILSGGQTFGSSFYAVPFSQMSWGMGQGQGQGANTYGSFTFNGDVTRFEGAPSLDSLDTLDGSSFNDVESYWMDAGGSTMP